jgi:uncharacterized membrane protein
MNRMAGVLILLIVVAVAQLAWLAPGMPDVVATHFDGAGKPNGWMSRAGMVGFQLTILGVMGGIFLGLPVLLRRDPTMINLPHREYWLSPERRDRTIATIRNWMTVVGCGVVLLLMAVTGMLHHANRMTPPRLSSPMFVACLSAFLLFIGGAIVALYRRFPRPDSAQRT